mgnify:CR=1 FL=1
MDSRISADGVAFEDGRTVSGWKASELGCRRGDRLHFAFFGGRLHPPGLELAQDDTIRLYIRMGVTDQPGAGTTGASMSPCPRTGATTKVFHRTVGSVGPKGFPGKTGGQAFYSGAAPAETINVAMPVLVSMGDDPTQGVLLYFPADHHQFITLRPEKI